MKVLLDVIVVCATSSKMLGQVDRLYPNVAGFEYEGLQHLKPTAKYGGQVRDLFPSQ